MNYLKINNELLTVGLAAMSTLVVLLVAISVLRKRSREDRRYPKVGALLGWQLFLLALIAYQALPLLPSGRVQALNVANTFMSYLSSGDYLSAQALISGAMSESEHELIQSSLRNPANRPVTWQLEITGSMYTATGEVTLEDNSPIPLSIYLEWKWELASWKISGVRYDPYGSAVRADGLRFDLYTQGIPYSWVKTTTIILAAVSALFSLRYLFAVPSRKPSKILPS